LEEAAQSEKDRECASPVAAESVKPWEIRMSGESPRAFNAFCFYRAMGYRRSIKACMELHGIEAKKYGSWARWARLFDWKNRAALYDEFIAKETEKGLINEHVEHRKCFMAMIYYFGRSPTRQAASGRAFRGSALTRFIAPLRSATANAAPTIPNVGSDG